MPRFRQIVVVSIILLTPLSVIADDQWVPSQEEHPCGLNWVKQTKCTELKDENGRFKQDGTLVSGCNGNRTDWYS